MKKRFFKKNQIIITALAVLIAIAGYINYADSTLKKGKDSKSTSTVTEAAEGGKESAAGGDENSILQDIESLDYERQTAPEQRRRPTTELLRIQARKRLRIPPEKQF